MNDTPENTPSDQQPEVDASAPISSADATPAPAPLARPPVAPRPVAPVSAAKAPAPKFISPMPKIDESENAVPAFVTVIACVAAIATIAFAVLLFLKR